MCVCVSPSPHRVLSVGCATHLDARVDGAAGRRPRVRLRVAALLLPLALQERRRRPENKINTVNSE